MARAKKTGCLVLRNGIYYIRVKRNGKVIVSSLKTSSKEEAEFKGRLFIQNLCFGREYSKLKTFGVPIKDIFNRFVKDCNCGERTLQCYRYKWRHFTSFLRIKRIKE